jgi:flagellar hook-associated protein 1 FlgK
MPVSTSLSIASQALLVAQTAMDVTSHNMANVNTEGYSRQMLDLVPAPPYQSPFGPMGTGVTGQTIRRITDLALTRNLIDKTATLGKYETEKSAIQQMETIFNESGGQGLNQVLSDFWNAWEDLANQPEGSPERLALVEKSQALVSSIDQLKTDMDQQQTALSQQLEDTITEINQITGEIADLNKEITKIEASGDQANDARDQRELQLKKLSELIDINQFEDPNTGSVQVMTAKGNPLVNGAKSWKLGASRDSSGDVQVVWINANGGQDDISATIERGKVGGLLNLQHTVFKDFTNQFNDFAAALIREVNRQHAQGVGLTPMTEAVSTSNVPAYARLETAFPGEDNDLLFTAKAPDANGDAVQVAIVNPGLPDQPLGVTVAGQTVTISLETNAFGQPTTTAADLADFVSHDTGAGAQAARDLVSVQIAEGNSGRGTVGTQSATNLNRSLSRLLPFGDEITSGGFDLITYDASGQAVSHTIQVQPGDTREDLLAQIGETFDSGVAGVRASISTDSSGQQRLKIEADTQNGYAFSLTKDTSNVLMALGLNTFFTGHDATDIGLNPAMEENLSLIAAGQVNDQGQIVSGNNENALEIANIKDRTFAFQYGSSTISEAYNTLSADIGSTAYSIYRNSDFTESLVNQIQQQRDNVSAVSVDEELTTMIKFQYAYMAASKIISTTGEMLTALVNTVG